MELSTIRQDLYRRDFTINTLAIRLNPGHFGELIDFFGGQRDIKNRTIKIIHNLSFVEDPTRIFRALRFERRFGFSISKETGNLIRNAVKMGIPQRLSGTRIFGELHLILQEDDPASIIKRMADFDLLRFFHPQITYDNARERLMESINEVFTWFELLFFNEQLEKWRVYFLGMVDGLKDEEFLEFSTRLSFLKKNTKKILMERRQSKSTLSKLEWLCRQHRVCSMLDTVEDYIRSFYYEVKMLPVLRLGNVHRAVKPRSAGQTSVKPAGLHSCLYRSI